jgi:hypothetical protein
MLRMGGTWVLTGFKEKGAVPQAFSAPGPLTNGLFRR